MTRWWHLLGVTVVPMAGTGLAVARGAPGSIAVVAGLAFVTLGALRVIPAALQRRGGGDGIGDTAMGVPRVSPHCPQLTWQMPFSGWHSLAWPWHWHGSQVPR